MNTRDNYQLYLSTLLRGKWSPLSFTESALSPHTPNYHLDDGNSAPFVIVLKRGAQITFCSGCDDSKKSPDVTFSSPAKAFQFQTIAACFYYLHLKFSNQEFIQEMISTEQFQVWDYNTLSRYNLRSSIARVSNDLGSAAGILSVPAALSN